MAKFFSLDGDSPAVPWLKKADERLTATLKYLEENRNDHDLALPFYLREVGAELFRLILLNKVDDKTLNHKLCNPATFALLGMNDIIQNNVALYKKIKESGIGFSGNKEGVARHLLEDMPRDILDFAKGLPGYDSAKNELEQLKTAIAHNNKGHVTPVSQMQSLCALIVWDKPEEAKKNIEILKLKDTQQRYTSVFRKMDAGSITLGGINPQDREDTSARSIVAHVLLIYTGEMLNYKPIRERLDTIV